MTVEINGAEFTLLPEKALYKADEQLLVIADVHLGKASHFRKEGISIPLAAQMGDYDNLRQLFDKIKPQRVYFLGDLFHSSFNRDWHYFCDLIAKYPGIQFTLIRGNHDLIDEQLFKDICISVTDEIEDEAFIYSHDELENIAPGKINIVGHIHPGIILSGMGRQSLKLPCFYLTRTHFILPAFGVLTGLYSMDRTADSKVFIVLRDAVTRL
jgi:DNA ligase-associated metallophosphoesterase